MPAQETIVVAPGDDQVQTSPSESQQAKDAMTFDLRAEIDVVKRLGIPRILNLNDLNTENIPSFANDHKLADIILTLVYHLEGAEGVQACMQSHCADCGYGHGCDFKYQCDLEIAAWLDPPSAVGTMRFDLHKKSDSISV